MQLIADFKHVFCKEQMSQRLYGSGMLMFKVMNKNTVLMCWICSDQRNLWHTWITIPQQEVKAMVIVIPSFIQQRITTVLLDCTSRVEINI